MDYYSCLLLSQNVQTDQREVVSATLAAMHTNPYPSSFGGFILRLAGDLDKCTGGATPR